MTERNAISRRTFEYKRIDARAQRLDWDDSKDVGREDSSASGVNRV